MESAELRGSQTVWNQPGLSMRSYVCEPKKSRCACRENADKTQPLVSQ